MFDQVFVSKVKIDGNRIYLSAGMEGGSGQQQTTLAFSQKWRHYMQTAEEQRQIAYRRQRVYSMVNYGFSDEADLKHFLSDKSMIVDAGCGVGHKAAWLAELAPHATVLAYDASDSLDQAGTTYRDIKNLFFVKADIAATGLADGSIDLVNCDQVIHHTADPGATLAELVRATKPGGSLFLYVYAKKALPRELLDEHFREKCKILDDEALLEMSRQITSLGKTLSDLHLEIVVPDIPLFGIEGGTYDLQRFFYWNFFKCFYNEELGFDISVMTNYDWYAPAQAFRYSREEFLAMIEANGLEVDHFHYNRAAYTGRFHKPFDEIGSNTVV